MNDNQRDNNDGTVFLNDGQSQSRECLWCIDYCSQSLDCRDSKCGKKIEAGSLRMARYVPNPYQPGSYTMVYKHLDCMFKEFKKQNVKRFITNPNELNGWENLKYRDQERLKFLINDLVEYRSCYMPQTTMLGQSKNGWEGRKRPICLEETNSRYKTSGQKNKKAAKSKPCKPDQLKITKKKKGKVTKQVNKLKKITPIFEPTFTSCSRTLPYNDFPGLKYAIRLPKGLRVHLPRDPNADNEKKDLSLNNSNSFPRSILKQNNLISGIAPIKEVRINKPEPLEKNSQKIRIKFATQSYKQKRILDQQKENLADQIKISRKVKTKRRHTKHKMEIGKTTSTSATKKINLDEFGGNVSKGQRFSENSNTKLNGSKMGIAPVAPLLGCDILANQANLVKPVPPLLEWDFDVIVNCCKCSYFVKLKNAEMLSFHMMKKHQLKLFVCPACPNSGKFFYVLRQLKQHIMTHHNAMAGSRYKDLMENLNLQTIILQSNETLYRVTNKRVSLTKPHMNREHEHKRRKLGHKSEKYGGEQFKKDEEKSVYTYSDRIVEKYDTYRHVPKQHNGLDECLQFKENRESYMEQTLDIDDNLTFQGTENDNLISDTQKHYFLTHDNSHFASKNINGCPEKESEYFDYKNLGDEQGNVIDHKDNELRLNTEFSDQHGMQIEMTKEYSKFEILQDGRKDISCTLCNNFFSSQWELQRHWYMFHI